MPVIYNAKGRLYNLLICFVPFVLFSLLLNWHFGQKEILSVETTAYRILLSLNIENILFDSVRLSNIYFNQMNTIYVII